MKTRIHQSHGVGMFVLSVSARRLIDLLRLLLQFNSHYR